MSHPKKFYWSITGLMAVFMLMASVPDLLILPAAVEIFAHLGYPAYLLPFLGTAKILGVGAVVFPGTSRLKEWAYAGLVFDLAGALYSHLRVGDPASIWMFPVIGLVLVVGSYALFRQQGHEGSRLFHSDLVPAHGAQPAERSAAR